VHWNFIRDTWPVWLEKCMLLMWEKDKL